MPNQEEWSDELDALIAAPKNHALLLENERVRILDTRVRPGETVPLHTHRWPGTVYILSSSHFVRRDAEGRVTKDCRGDEPVRSGSAYWSEPLPPHTFENIGETEFRAITVELKSE